MTGAKFERRELFLNPFVPLVTTIAVVSFGIYVPLSVKGILKISTHCSEFSLDDPYISWPHLKEQVNHKIELAAFGVIVLAILLIFSVARPSKIGQVVLNIGDRVWYMLDVKLFRLLFTGYNILLGFLIILILLGFVKHTAGELRPCFLEVCQPNLTLIQEMKMLEPGKVLFNREICTNTDIDYYCMSFFSGHTVTAFYAATICVMLLQYMDKEKQRLFTIRFLAQCLIVSLASWVAITRMQDHYHHVIDIAVAIFVGVSVAVFITATPLMHFNEERLGKKSGEIGALLTN